MKMIPNIHHKDFDSTSLRSATFVSKTGKLTLSMVQGQRIEYSGVSIETYTDLCNAKSPGRFYNLEIRDKYKFRYV